MKEIIIKQSGTNLVSILVTFKTYTGIHTSFLQCEKFVYTEALFAGCSGKSRQDFLNELKALGSKISIDSSRDNITISIFTIKPKLTQTLRLIERMLSKPNFNSKEITRIKKLLTNEMILSKENARTQSDRNFYAALIKKTDTRYPFSKDELIGNVSAVKRSGLVRLHKNILNSMWFISFAGNTTAVREARKIFKKLNSIDFPSKKIMSVKTIDIKKNIICLENIPSKQNIEFNLGNTVSLNYTDDEYPAFVFGMSVLALYGGFSGRLMSTVREKEGLTYSIYGHTEYITKKDTGIWRISTFFAPEKTKQGLESTIREIKKIVKRGITEKELVRFKSILRTRQMLINDSMIKKIVRAHNLLLSEITEKNYTYFNQEIQNLTKEKVNRVLKKYINPDKLVVSAAGPIKDTLADIKKLFS